MGGPTALAVHKPGAVPLRPLKLADIYDAAFRVVRRNPQATVGSALLVTVVAMTVPVLATMVFTWSIRAADAPSGETWWTSVSSTLLALVFGTVLQSVGLVLVSGMIAHVVSAAALGRRLTLPQAWQATHGKRWRLIGLTTLIFGLLGGSMVAFVGLMISASGNSLGWLSGLVFGGLLLGGALAMVGVRVFYLSVPALMLEPVGVFAAIGRSFALTRGQFWRTLGIAILTAILVYLASSLLTMPVSLITQLAILAVDDVTLWPLIMVAGQAVSAVIAAAFATPFAGAVTCLQYLDQRMRKEAYDVELLSQAGLTLLQPTSQVPRAW